jgi:hypothetical protein
MKTLGTTIGIAIVVMVLMALSSVAWMWLWNYLMPYLFKLPTLSFWQAFAMVLMISFIKYRYQPQAKQ